MPYYATNGKRGPQTFQTSASTTMRVTAVLLIILFIFLGWTFFWLLYAERQSLLDAKRQALWEQLSSAVSVCEYYQTRADEPGTYTMELRQAQAEALAVIGHMRYGNTGQGYFMVVDNAGVLLAHPLRTDLVGSSLSRVEDKAGQQFIVRLIRSARENDRGYLTYRWQWGGATASSAPRLACYARYEPWDWILVSEASTADIDEAISREIDQQVLVLVVLSLVLALVLSSTLRRLVLAGVDRLILVARRLQGGDLAARAPATAAEELSPLAIAINQMADGIQHRDAQLRKAQRAAVFALAKLAEARDNETGGHLLRVREYALVLARALAAEPEYAEIIDSVFLDDLFDATMLHDIGKVGIPDTILLKPDTLDEGEMAIMMSHTLIGANTIRTARRQMGVEGGFLVMAEQIARSHHERWDGSGYVEALKATQIPLAARIFAVADVYDALTTERPYKRAYPHEQTVEMMCAERGRQFDPQIFDAFLRVHREFDTLRRATQEENHR